MNIGVGLVGVSRVLLFLFMWVKVFVVVVLVVFCDCGVVLEITVLKSVVFFVLVFLPEK